MCYLVTIGTREPVANIKALLGAGPDSPLTVYAATNPSLKSIFPANDHLFHVIVGQCSCDLVIPDKKGKPREALGPWLRKLAPRKGGVRVFVHLYSGEFDKERLSSRETIRVPVDRLVDASVLGADRLVDVVAAPKPTR